ncbi:hypothetical protein BpHYR1_048794 [Brachionus plicatilis]|uniref:Uncharacterized protein n=1 Tax=Brachionus plicatilis TaxID=10195 RepID=A0A3M7QH02_BRAPC|nr:hypothetical protein BpHYR1_048794 [Brachionus plicatilis]
MCNVQGATIGDLLVGHLRKLSKSRLDFDFITLTFDHLCSAQISILEMLINRLVPMPHETD